jgi:hypothetical protein
MTAAQLGRALREAGYVEARIACRVHEGEPARFVCAGCRRPLCRACAVLRRGRLRCAGCRQTRAPWRGRIWRLLRDPAGASAACILALSLFSVVAGDRLAAKPMGVSYAVVGEPPAVARAMGTLQQAHRMRRTGDRYAAHGLDDAAAFWRSASLRAYEEFERLYPADDPDVPASCAAAASRYARARLSGSAALMESVARDYPLEAAGILAWLEVARRRVEAAPSEDLEAELRRTRGVGMDAVARAMGQRSTAARRGAIERFTGADFNAGRVTQELDYLLGRLREAQQRPQEAAFFYREALKGADHAGARAGLDRVAGGPESIQIKRFQN